MRADDRSLWRCFFVTVPWRRGRDRYERRRPIAARRVRTRTLRAVKR